MTNQFNYQILDVVLTTLNVKDSNMVGPQRCVWHFRRIQKYVSLHKQPTLPSQLLVNLHLGKTCIGECSLCVKAIISMEQINPLNNGVL